MVIWESINIGMKVYSTITNTEFTWFT